MIFPGQHIAIFGMSGCGKSTLTGKISEIFKRKIIFDRLGEWDDAHGNIADDFDSFALIYGECHSLNSFEIVIRPSPGTGAENLTALTDKILSLVYRVETHNTQGIGVIFEEVWLYAPLHSTPPWFLEILLTGRHKRISIIGNSQRPANVSKTLVTQCRHVFIGEFFEMNDRKYFRECFGDAEFLNTPPKKFDFYWVNADSQTPDKTRLISVTP